MCVGETIYRLRRERNLSQGDLADRLNVSRQSVSRWETGGAVPELDKLIRMSHLFGVTLDELVSGEEPGAIPVSPSACVPSPPREGFSPRKVAGTVLFCMGFLTALLLSLLGGLAAGLVFASPFLVCGGLCFLFRRRAGLWCGWAVCFLIDLYLRYGSGITWRLTWVTLSFTPQMNYARLFIAWTQLIGMGLLVLLTVICFRNTTADLSPFRKRIAYIGGWTLFFLLPIPLYFSFWRPWWLLTACIDWGRLLLLAALLATTAGWLRRRRGLRQQGIPSDTGA